MKMVRKSIATAGAYIANSSSCQSNAAFNRMMHAINAEAARNGRVSRILCRPAPNSMREVVNERNAMIQRGDLIGANILVKRPKHRMITPNANSENKIYSFAQIVTITQIGLDLTEKNVTETLDQWLSSVPIKREEWTIKMQNTRPTSVAKVYFDNPERVEPAVYFIKAAIKKIKEQRKEQPELASYCWRGPFRSPNPEVCEMAMVTGVDLIKRFQAWLNKKPIEENLAKIVACLQAAPGFVFRIRMKVWIDNVEKVTATRIGFIDETQLLIPKIVSRPFTVMVFQGHENLLKLYSDQFSQELTHVVDPDIVHNLSIYVEETGNTYIIPTQFSLFVSMADHAATKFLINSKGGTSQSRDYSCPGSVAFVFSRVIGQGACVFEVKSHNERWEDQKRRIDDKIDEIAGTTNPKQRCEIRRTKHIFQAMRGLLVAAPLFAVAGPLLTGVVLIPPQMHNSMFYALQLMKLAMAHLITEDMPGYGTLKGTHTNFE